MALVGERVFNLLAGLSVLGWAVAGVVQDREDINLVRLSVTLLNAVVGTLFIIRSLESAAASPRAILLTIPSFILCGLLFRLSHLESIIWPAWLSWLFVIATIWTVISLSFLGRSFSVLPSFRKVVSRGTYRFVRHPIYLGETILAGTCAIAMGHFAGPLIFMALVAALVCRIRVEEAFLNESSPNYLKYVEVVRWRLIPFVW